MCHQTLSCTRRLVLDTNLILTQNLRHSQCLTFLHFAQILGQILYLEGKPIAVNLVAACVQLK